MRILQFTLTRMDNDRVKKVYDLEIKRDLIEIETDKQKFIREMKGGLGKKINSFDTYVKKEPNAFQRLKQKINRIFNAI